MTLLFPEILPDNGFHRGNVPERHRRVAAMKLTTLILTLLLATPSEASPTSALRGAPHAASHGWGAPLSPAAETGAIPGSVLTSMSALRGYATWYATPGLTGAAGPVLRAALGGDPAFRGKRVTVCSGRCVTVTLTDWCACHERAGEPTLVDLSQGAFRRLAPLSSGVIEVTIRVAERPDPTLPATDTLTPSSEGAKP